MEAFWLPACTFVKAAADRLSLCSTLDPSIRMEDDGISPVFWILLGVLLTYLTATPGVLQGFFDTYFIAPFLGLTRPSLKRTDIKIGTKLAEGGFGTVYYGEAVSTVPGQVEKGDVRASYRLLLRCNIQPGKFPSDMHVTARAKHVTHHVSPARDPTRYERLRIDVNGFVAVQKLIVKKALEFGEAEVWMNERLTRAAPQAIAAYLTAYADGPPQAGTPLVLAWKFEGKQTLDEIMKGRDFPLNCEEALLGRKLRIKDGTQRRLATIKVRRRACCAHAGRARASDLHMFAPAPSATNASHRTFCAGDHAADHEQPVSHAQHGHRAP